MRPENNRQLDWEEVTLDPVTMRGTFKLNQHKNVNKGIKARGPIARELVEYLLSIRPPNASGPIHPNPETGLPYVDIRKQWKRLLKIAAEILGYKLTGKWNIRDLHCYSVSLAAAGNPHLVRDLVRVVSHFALP
jgi:hypothetical protein